MVLCGVSVYGVWVSDGAQRDGARARGRRASGARSASDERVRERGALRSSTAAAKLQRRRRMDTDSWPVPTPPKTDEGSTLF